VRAKELDARTDLFSFGAVMYEMCAGVLPFRGESAGVIFEATLSRAPTPFVRLNPDMPADLERIINKCLEKDRNLRYQNASDVRADLKRMEWDTDSARVAALASCHEVEERYIFVAFNTGLPYWQEAEAGFKDAAKQMGVKVELTGPAAYSPDEELRHRTKYSCDLHGCRFTGVPAHLVYWHRQLPCGPGEWDEYGGLAEKARGMS
jgi:serine/threonine protein kinase